MYGWAYRQNWENSDLDTVNKNVGSLLLPALDPVRWFAKTALHHTLAYIRIYGRKLNNKLRDKHHLFSCVVVCITYSIVQFFFLLYGPHIISENVWLTDRYEAGRFLKSIVKILNEVWRFSGNGLKMSVAVEGAELTQI